MSIYRLQRQPGTESGNNWWLDYRAPLNRIRIADALDAGEFSHPFYKGLWYWFEIETRVQEWRQRLPAVPFVRFETDWFNEPQRLVALAMELGIAVDRRQIDSSVGVKEHTREHLKLIAPLQPDEAQGCSNGSLLCSGGAVQRRRLHTGVPADALGQFGRPRTLTRPWGGFRPSRSSYFSRCFDGRREIRYDPPHVRRLRRKMITVYGEPHAQPRGRQSNTRARGLTDSPRIQCYTASNSSRAFC